MAIALKKPLIAGQQHRQGLAHPKQDQLLQGLSLLGTPAIVLTIPQSRVDIGGTEVALPLGW
jgi:hypothetical protein